VAALVFLQRNRTKNFVFEKRQSNGFVAGCADGWAPFESETPGFLTLVLAAPVQRKRRLMVRFP